MSCCGTHTSLSICFWFVVISCYNELRVKPVPRQWSKAGRSSKPKSRHVAFLFIKHQRHLICIARQYYFCQYRDLLESIDRPLQVDSTLGGTFVYGCIRYCSTFVSINTFISIICTKNNQNIYIISFIHQIKQGISPDAIQFADKRNILG